MSFNFILQSCHACRLLPRCRLIINFIIGMSVTTYLQSASQWVAFEFERKICKIFLAGNCRFSINVPLTKLLWTEQRENTEEKDCLHTGLCLNFA